VTPPARLPAPLAAASSPPPPPTGTPNLSRATATPPSFRVRLISINPESLGEIGADPNAMQPTVQARPRAALEQALARLERDKAAHVLSERPIAASAAPREILLDALGAGHPGPHAIRLRMRTLPSGRLKVEPEARVMRPQGGVARRAEEDLALAAGDAVLVSSLLEHREGKPVLPGEGGAREPRLVLVITPTP
jgi:hypothetical protein